MKVQFNPSPDIFSNINDYLVDKKLNIAAEASETVRYKQMCELSLIFYG